ncbi:hypothetical protein PVAP13_1NG319619 [Panicum virgatum]|uniref:Uncharacterized protein n=1 Tax=Panicum virgatum TaxID=38727 RepID=A0A8T0WVH9_PANVG|nr:hypothetical protein PVAP13_1NG319619 [Panicum virgatum]
MACRLSYSTSTARSTGPDLITALFVGNLAGSGRPGAHRPTRLPVPSGTRVGAGEDPSRQRPRSDGAEHTCPSSVLPHPPAPFLSQGPSPSPGAASTTTHSPHESFLFRRRHRVCATTGCGGGDRRQQAGPPGADRIGCAARPQGLSGGGGDVAEAATLLRRVF